jgi:hypothetical protein
LQHYRGHRAAWRVGAGPDVLEEASMPAALPRHSVQQTPPSLRPPKRRFAKAATGVSAVLLALTALWFVPNGSIASEFSHDITEAEIDALIDQLGDEDFATREAAQKKLIDESRESAANYQKIRKRLKEKGLTSEDAEIVARSRVILGLIGPHYTCYTAEGHNPNLPVEVRSQFGLHTVTVTQAHELCLPSLKNPTGTEAEQRQQLATLQEQFPHLRLYRIEGGPDPAGERKVHDQFGALTADVEEATDLLSPVIKDPNRNIPPDAVPPADPHYLCFRFPTEGGEADLDARRSQFGLREDVGLDTPSKLCVPVIKRPVGTEAEQKQKLAELEAKFPNLLCRRDVSGEDRTILVELKTQFTETPESAGVRLVDLFCGPAEKSSGTQGAFKLTDDKLVTVDNVIIDGDMTIAVDFNGLGDADKDMLDDVPLQVTFLELTGTSTLLGPVTLRLRPTGSHPFRASTGRIEERSNLTPGLLDLPPFTTSGTARSFFDLFIQIEAPSAPPGLNLLHNQAPKRMQAEVTQEPPDAGETFRNLQATPLLNEFGQPTGLRIGTTFLTPEPAPFCDLDADDDVDRLDITALVAAAGSLAGHADIRDLDFDGRITVNDARLCSLRCTKAQCAP